MHGSPGTLPQYLQKLIPKLHDLSDGFSNRVYQLAVQASSREYQLPEQVYQPHTSFP